MDRLIPSLSKIHAETRGDPRVSVAIIDGPVDVSHECFRGADLAIVDTGTTGEAGSGAAIRHGTHVASLLFGRADSAVPGIVPAARGIVLPLFSDGPDGRIVAGSQLDLARLITRAVALGAAVINLSGGEPSTSSEPHWALVNAIRLCEAEGVVLVAAAGNDGCECIHVPGASPSVLVVGALGANGEPAPFSNWGEEYRAHGILAPGERVPGAVPGGGVAEQNGTSYAAAIVSGVVALLLSLELLRGRPRRPQDVVSAILASAIGCHAQTGTDPRGTNCDRLLRGRLDVAGAQRLLEHASSRAGAIQSSGTDPSPSRGRTDSPMSTRAQDPQQEMNRSDAKAEAILPSGVIAPGEVVGPAGVMPSGCGCGAQPAGLGYVLGQVGFDFGSQARRDSLVEHAGNPLHDAGSLLDYLKQNPWEAPSIIWTLHLDGNPIYAVQPQGPYAAEAYRRLQEFLADGEIERVSIAGYVRGSMTLLSGQSVPIIVPELRGMASWSTKALVEHVRAVVGESGTEVKSTEDLSNFLARVYDELRNLGVSPRDRALNYAATNAFQVAKVFAHASAKDLNLQSIGVERSSIGRPGSECWDVKLVFFDPKRKTETAQKAYRFTVDVSDVVPVTVGKVRSWNTY